MKISVIIPVYNSSTYLRKCLDSVVNQTLKDIEIIVINDGSTDDSKNIIEEYLCKYKNKNIIFIDQENKGIGKTRNIGIKKATGEYITFVDSDDYIKENMLEEYYKYAKKHNFDLVIGSYIKKINNKEIIFENNKFKTGNVKTTPQILYLIEYGPWAKLYKREMLINNNIYFDEKRKYEDMPFVSKALLKSKLIGQITEPYYYYIIHNNSETTTMDKRVFDILDILKEIKDYYKREYYLRDELDYVIIDKITTYMLQQRVQKDNKLRIEFINAGYAFLNKNIKNWRGNKYYKKTNFLKRIIKNNKKILKIYCNIYAFIKRK